MIKRHSGTQIFPKRIHVVWSERALFILQISEIKFLGNSNHERWDSELNATLLPENMTCDQSVTKPITTRKTNDSLFQNIFWWYLWETSIARNVFSEMNSFRDKKKKIDVTFWLNNFVCWELKSISVNEFQWNLRNMLADNYLNIYIYRSVIFLD